MALPGLPLRCHLCENEAKMYCLCAKEPLALCCGCVPKHNEEQTDHQLCSLLAHCLITSATTSSERSYKSAVLSMLEKEINESVLKLRKWEEDWDNLVTSLIHTLVEKRERVREDLQRLTKEFEEQVVQVVDDLANNRYESSAINTLMEVTFVTDPAPFKAMIANQLCHLSSVPSPRIAPALRFLQACYLPSPVYIKTEEAVKSDGGKVGGERVKKGKSALKVKVCVGTIAVDEGDTLVIQSRSS